MSQTGDEARLAIALDRDGDVPLGVQLAWALRARIESGALGAGDRLPGLQRLAEAVGVNANTVRAVYQRLEHEGLVATRHGSGTFVTGAGSERRALAQVAAEAARAARDAGVDPRAVAAALYVGAEEATRGATPTRDADERRRLRAQIAALEQALSELTARQAAPAAGARPAPARAGRAAGPHLPSAAELQRTREQLLQRLAAAQVARDPDEPRPPPTPARPGASVEAQRLRPVPREA